MSASKLLPATLLAISGLVLAADGDSPEMDFLEYLGMWEESDDEWLIFEDEQVAMDVDERIDPVPEGEESTESKDEG